MGSGDVLSVNQAVEGLETARHTRPHRSERSTPFRQPGATQGAPGCRKRAERSPSARAVSRPLGRMDGRSYHDPSIRPAGRHAPLQTGWNCGIHVF